MTFLVNQAAAFRTSPGTADPDLVNRICTKRVHQVAPVSRLENGKIRGHSNFNSTGVFAVRVHVQRWQFPQ